VGRKILFTGDNERDELAFEFVVEVDEQDDRESDLPLFPALGVVSIFLFGTVWWLDQSLLALLSHD
jgi:hypothetical protein